MRSYAIKNICKKFKELNIDLSQKVALDFFAREGDWQTQYYSTEVLDLYAWEIDVAYESMLRKNLPNAKISIGDSFKLAAEKLNFFDMVVLDNPMGCFGKNQEYCEHFEALPLALEMLKKTGGLLIFNIKTKPFNYENKTRWQKRRNDFYLVNNASNLSKDFIFKFYKTFFNSLKYEVEFLSWQCRPQEDNLYSCAVKVSSII